MWSYYGSKLKIVNHYPAPVYNTIIEPFAGAAQYSLKYFDRDVILVDKYDVIIRLWKWLQQCSSNDILSLPNIDRGKTVDDFQWDCIEQKWLIGFIIAAGVSSPRKTPSKWRTTIRPNGQRYKLQEIAKSLYKIKHWKFVLGEYSCLENVQATWFIDPPYQYGGQHYKVNGVNYSELSDWCKSRKGQVIVCENEQADWMNFSPLISMQGVKFKRMETIWTNM